MKKKSKQLKNKDMNNEVYALRRRVMNFIYEARELAELPRVEVRITDSDFTKLNKYNRLLPLPM
jgi:hypothetical protein